MLTLDKIEKKNILFHMYCEKINLIIFKICQRSILILFGPTNRSIHTRKLHIYWAQKFRLFGLLNKKLNMCQFDYNFNYIQIRNLIFGNISGN